MGPVSPSRRGRPVLSLQSLEGREVPAGVITASVSPAGVLTIVGDDLANTVQIKVTGTDVLLTPDATTAIFGNPVNTPVTIADVATSLKADLKGGNDSFSIDPTSKFTLTGPASIKLGDGNNNLDLVTNQELELGGLTVYAGDGADTVDVAAGAGLGKVTGLAKVDLGIGASILVISETKFTGPAGLKISAGTLSVTGTNVTVDKTLTLAGISGTSLSLTGGSLGGLSVSDKFSASAGLNGTPVNGNVSLKGDLTSMFTTNAAITGNLSVKSNFQTQLTVNNVTVGGNVDVVGGFIAAATFNTAPVTGNVSVKADFQSQLALNGSAVSGNATVNGGFVASFNTSGVASVLNATLKGKIQSQLQVSGTSLTVNGNLSTSGNLATSANFSTTALSEVKGNISVKGGTLQNTFTTNEFFKASKNLTMNLGDGNNIINLGNGAAAIPIAGNLSITSGRGSTTVSLNNIAVAQATKINLGAGPDILIIERGSVFTGTFSADMGAGDDTVSIAQATGSAAAVTFTGRATIKTGAGNDTLLLGKGTGGDAFSTVAFNGAGSKIYGGANFNTFDDGTPMSYTGLTFGTSIVNFTDPSP
jgi:hypothetical protein